jgi:hypothetical protein
MVAVSVFVCLVPGWLAVMKPDHLDPNLSFRARGSHLTAVTETRMRKYIPQGYAALKQTSAPHSTLCFNRNTHLISCMGLAAS